MHSDEMVHVHAPFNRIMETVGFTQALTWVKFSFGSLCLHGPTAKRFQLASSIRLLNPHFQKSASGHFWTTVTVLAC